MQEWHIDFWQGLAKMESLGRHIDCICFTSNGVCKKNGDLVMGKGIALQFKERFPFLPRVLGLRVQSEGNRVHIVETVETYSGYRGNIASFPTKYHWKDPSDIKLIEQSAKELRDKADKGNWKRVILTRPGCGLGGLNWEKEVKPILEPLFDKRFIVVY